MKTMYRALVCLTLVFLSFSTSSAVAADTVVRGKSGAFTAWLLVFTDQEKYRRRGEGSFSLEELTAVPAKMRNAPMLVQIAIGGCKGGADGLCNVTVEFEMFDPDGSRSIHDENRKVWSKPAQPAELMMWGESPVPLMFEKGDAAGTYRLKATIRDNIANVKVELERQFMVEAE